MMIVRLLRRKYCSYRTTLRKILVIWIVLAVVVYLILSHIYPSQVNEDKYADIEKFFGKERKDIKFKAVYKIMQKNFCERVMDTDMLMINVFRLGNTQYEIATNVGFDYNRKKIRVRYRVLMEKIEECRKKARGNKKMGYVFHLLHDDMVDPLAEFITDFRKLFDGPIWVNANIFPGDNSEFPIDKDNFFSKFLDIRNIKLSLGWNVIPPSRLDKKDKFVYNFDFHPKVITQALDTVNNFQLKHVSFAMDVRYVVPGWENVLNLLSYNNHTSLRILGNPPNQTYIDIIKQKSEQNNLKIYFSDYFHNDSLYHWIYPTNNFSDHSGSSINDFYHRSRFSINSSLLFFVSICMILVVMLVFFNFLISTYD